MLCESQVDQNCTFKTLPFFFSNIFHSFCLSILLIIYLSIHFSILVYLVSCWYREIVKDQYLTFLLKPIHPFIYPSINIPICPSIVYLSICPSIIYLSIYNRPLHLSSTYPSITYLAVYLTSHLFIYLSIRYVTDIVVGWWRTNISLSNYPSIYLSN